MLHPQAATTAARDASGTSDVPPYRVALAHDYVTQRGGAERVALMMASAFPTAPMYTTLYEPAGTFPEFADVRLRPSVLNRVGPLRRNHRLALPLLAPAVSGARVDADVLLASSSGWAHGYRGARRTVVYCYIPARWLYQTDRYVGAERAGSAGATARRLAVRSAVGALSPALRRWDNRAAHAASRYLACSSVARRAIAETYGIDAEVLCPPPAMLPGGEERAVPALTPGYVLCVARLLPYKNVDLVIEAVRRLGGPELVVVGDGPDRARLTELAAHAPVRLLGRVSDPELRWLYRHASALVAASHEDFGLSPLEANAFAVPAVAWRSGGFLDTVVEGRTGAFFDELEPDQIADALDRASRTQWDPAALTGRAQEFGRERFVTRLREVVAEEAAA